VKGEGLEPAFRCSELDRVLVVTNGGGYKVIPPPEKLFVDRDLYQFELFARDQLYTLVYSTPSATYLKRFTFGGTILNKEYACVPPKAKIMLLTAEPLERVYIKYKPFKPGKRGGMGKGGNQPDEQIVELAGLPVQTPRQLGTLLSHKAVDWLKTTKPRGWNETGGAPMGPLFS